MRTLKRLFTAEELFHLPTVGRRLELVKGKVYEMAPAGGRHGYAAMNTGIIPGGHVRANGLGRVFAAETGFILRRDPDTVRAPDVAFISQSRLAVDEIPDSFIDLVPDLVVEVVSPGDTRREVREKVEDWLHSGVRLVWVLYSMEGVRQLGENDFLDGEDVESGFTCRLEELFA